VVPPGCFQAKQTRNPTEERNPSHNFNRQHLTLPPGYTKKHRGGAPFHRWPSEGTGPWTWNKNKRPINMSGPGVRRREASHSSQAKGALYGRPLKVDGLADMGGAGGRLPLTPTFSRQVDLSGRPRQHPGGGVPAWRCPAGRSSAGKGSARLYPNWNPWPARRWADRPVVANRTGCASSAKEFRTWCGGRKSGHGAHDAISLSSTLTPNAFRRLSIEERRSVKRRAGQLPNNQTFAEQLTTV